MSTPELLEWVNGFELVISVAAIYLLVRFIIGKVNGFRDVWDRLMRAFSRDFQGGSYDLAVALLVLIAGKAMRAAVIWEWRHFGGDLNYYLLAFAIFVISVGMLCAIRVLAPSENFNSYSIGIGILAVALASVSVYL